VAPLFEPAEQTGKVAGVILNGWRRQLHVTLGERRAIPPARCYHFLRHFSFPHKHRFFQSGLNRDIDGKVRENPALAGLPQTLIEFFI